MRSKDKENSGKSPLRMAERAPEILDRAAEALKIEYVKTSDPDIDAFAAMRADKAARADLATRYAEALVAYLVRSVAGLGAPAMNTTGFSAIELTLCGHPLPFLLPSLLINGRAGEFEKVSGREETAPWPAGRDDDENPWDVGARSPWEAAGALGAAWQGLMSPTAIIEAVHHVWQAVDEDWEDWPGEDEPAWQWAGEIILGDEERSESELLGSPDMQVAFAKLHKAAKPPKLRHPLGPLVRQWHAARLREATPFFPKARAVLPRFDRSTIEEARLLSAREPAPDGSGQLELLHTDDVVESCPTWLLGMYLRAVSLRTGRKLGSTRSGMPWSFTLTIGGVAHFAISDRRKQAPDGRDLRFTLETLNGKPGIIDWIHPKGWGSRRRDWARLDEAFEETPSYRVTVDDRRYSVVTAYGLPRVYSPSARVTLNVRVPPSAAHGARFDWHRYHVDYAKRATLQRALLSTAGLLDRTASRGNPLTRRVLEPVLDEDGKPKRERIIGRDGKPKRDEQGRYRTRALYTGRVVPNPLLGSIQPAVLPDQHLALFLGMPNTRSSRQDAKSAIETLHADDVIDLERVPNGYRIFGPSPKEPAAE